MEQLLPVASVGSERKGERSFEGWRLALIFAVLPGEQPQLDLSMGERRLFGETRTDDAVYSE